MDHPLRPSVTRYGGRRFASNLRRLPSLIVAVARSEKRSRRAGARVAQTAHAHLHSTPVPEALVIVDFQNDFTPGGALAVPDGDAVAAHLNDLIASGRFDLVVATRDWHPLDHSSFAEQGGPWPVHCVAGTEGAQLHPALDAAKVDVIVDKGTERDTEGYSGFDATDLAELLRDRGIDSLTVAGLATDYCVRATALDAAHERFDVTVVEDAIRAVEVDPGDGERALDDMRAAGTKVASSEELLAAARG